MAPDMDKLSEARRAFLADSFKTHVEQIRVSQARRFEILRYIFVGYFAYWAFLFGTERTGIICNFPFETVVLIPGFLLLQAFLYIGMLNRNIHKHGAFLAYLFDNGLAVEGLGENLYAQFLKTREGDPGALARGLNALGVHYSQLVLGVLAGAALLLYVYVEANGGFGLMVVCPSNP
ncbi:MAG: hypothetical protein AAGH68_04000 [Pseudomonadota bacterium]